MQSTSHQDRDPFNTAFAALTVVAVAVLVGWSYFSFTRHYNGLVNHAAKEEDKSAYLTALAQRGDSFGSWNALFSGGALVAVVVTLWFQILQLREQRKSTELQLFESSFYNLLSLHNEIPKEMCVNSDSHPIFYNVGFTTRKHAEGYSCFALFEEVFGQIDDRSPQSAVGTRYASLYNAFEAELGHYFRMLYTVIRFIDDSSLSNEKKEDFARIVRAGLSSRELTFLFRNCIFGLGEEQFKPLVEKYSLLQNLASQKFSGLEYISRFEPKAFGDRYDILVAFCYLANVIDHEEDCHQFIVSGSLSESAIIQFEHVCQAVYRGKNADRGTLRCVLRPHYNVDTFEQLTESLGFEIDSHATPRDGEE